MPRRDPKERKDYQAYWREKNRGRRYGMKPGDFDAMLAAQGGVCAICHGPAGSKGFHVDHDHQTGRIRGILCQFCNKGLGMFRDNAAALAQAIAYLGRQ